MIKHIFYKKLDDNQNEIQVQEFKLWNFILGGLNVNPNEIYYALENIWWINSNSVCLCKICNTNLSLNHLIIKHKEIINENITEIKWLIRVKNNEYNFANAATKINGNAKEILEGVKNAIDILLKIKLKAIKELGKKGELK